MKATVGRTALQKALGVVGTVIPRKTTLATLEHVSISGTVDELVLTTTDMDVALRASVPAQVDKVGTVLVPFKPLAELSGISRGTTMDIQGMARHITRVRHRTAAGEIGLESKLKCMDHEEAPLVKLTGPKCGQMDADMFRRAVGWASSCASRTLDRPMLETVYIKTSGGRTVFVGTDGFRMAVSSLPVEAFPDDQIFMLPNRALVRNWKMYRDMDLRVAKGEDPVQVNFREASGSLIFEYPEFRTSHRLSGLSVYVDYKRAVPGDWNVRVVLDLGTLLDALKVVRTMAKRRGDFNKTVFQIRGNEWPSLTVYSFTDDDGDVAVTVPIEDIELGPGVDLEYMPFILNSYWTQKALTQFKGAVEQIAIEIVSPDRPFIFRPVGDTVWAGSYSFQMPMQDDKVIAHAEGEREADVELMGGEDEEL